MEKSFSVQKNRNIDKYKPANKNKINQTNEPSGFPNSWLIFLKVDSQQRYCIKKTILNDKM
jgi:hypothetical protein